MLLAFITITIISLPFIDFAIADIERYAAAIAIISPFHYSMFHYY
jgi:hypothetical protein